MNERDVLRRAKEVLLERGWTQGAHKVALHGTANGATCLGGAVCIAQGIGWEGLGGEPVARLLSDLISPGRRVTGGCIANWNDFEAKEIFEVIDLLDKAIASLEPSKTPELVA